MSDTDFCQRWRSRVSARLAKIGRRPDEAAMKLLLIASSPGPAKMEVKWPGGRVIAEWGRN